MQSGTETDNRNRSIIAKKKKGICWVLHFLTSLCVCALISSHEFHQLFWQVLEKETETPKGTKILCVWSQTHLSKTNRQQQRGQNHSTMDEQSLSKGQAILVHICICRCWRLLPNTNQATTNSCSSLTTAAGSTWNTLLIFATLPARNYLFKTEQGPQK